MTILNTNSTKSSGKDNYDKLLAVFHTGTDVKRCLLDFYLRGNHTNLLNWLSDKSNEIPQFEDVKRARRIQSDIQPMDLSLNTVGTILKYNCFDMYWNICLFNTCLEDILNSHKEEFVDIYINSNRMRELSSFQTDITKEEWELLFKSEESALEEENTTNISATKRITVSCLSNHLNCLLLSIVSPLYKSVIAVSECQVQISKIALGRCEIEQPEFDEIWNKMETNISEISLHCNLYGQFREQCETAKFITFNRFLSQENRIYVLAEIFNNPSCKITTITTESRKRVIESRVNLSKATEKMVDAKEKYAEVVEMFQDINIHGNETMVFPSEETTARIRKENAAFCLDTELKEFKLLIEENVETIEKEGAKLLKEMNNENNGDESKLTFWAKTTYFEKPMQFENNAYNQWQTQGKGQIQSNNHMVVCIGIMCNGIYVECILDKRLHNTLCDDSLYQSVCYIDGVTSFSNKMDNLNAMVEDSTNGTRDCSEFQLMVNACEKEFDAVDIFKYTVYKGFGLCCRLIIFQNGHRLSNEHLQTCMSVCIKNVNAKTDKDLQNKYLDTAKAISHEVARRFYLNHKTVSELKRIYPAFRCRCREKMARSGFVQMNYL